MNTTKLDHSNNSKTKKPYFWNTIDNKNLTGKGDIQDKDVKAVKENFFTKLIKKMNSAISKSSPFTGQRSLNKIDIKQAQSMGEIQIPKQYINTLKPIGRSYTLGNDATDWKNSLLCQLDEIKRFDNSDGNELITNTLQPSGMDSNRKANLHDLATMDEKLGVISKKTMINDWLHYNNIPNSSMSNTDMPLSSYLQHYHHHNNNLFSKQEDPESVKLKKQQGKKKHDHIKEKLDIAAARRNAIKAHRLREQMDTALYETMHLLRNNNQNEQKGNQILQQQDLEDLFIRNKQKKGGRKAYYSSDATTSSSLSNDYSLPNQHQKHDGLIW